MKNIYLLLLIVFFCACRKDNSTFENNANTSSSNGTNCLIIEGNDETSNVKTTVTYQLDSVIASFTSKEDPLQNFYLIQETPTKFICTEETNELKNATYRIYLNSFGAVDKEVEVTLNADGKTFTESTVNKNTYAYNSKKQLISIINNLDDEEGVTEFLYDEQNRIKEVLLKDELGEIRFRFNNFKFLSNTKKDNSFVLAPLATAGAYFIPSLRNVYITHYESVFEGLGIEPDTYDFEYNFSNGVLSKVKASYVIFGFPVEFIASYKFACK